MFERTWDTAIELCHKGVVQGQAYSVGAVVCAPEAAPRFAVLSKGGQVIFRATVAEDERAMGLFLAVRRFVELEEAFERGQEVAPYVSEPVRTALDSLREWGLVNENGTILKAYEPDPEPLLGYVVRVGNVYAYGVVKQSVLSSGTITPTGACDTPEEARKRASELLMLALVRGATVMGMNGIPAVIDLSAEPTAEPEGS